MGCHLWGRTESDTTEATQQQQSDKTQGAAYREHFPAKSSLEILTARHHSISMGLQGKVCLLQLFHADTGHHGLRIEDVNMWVRSITLPTILVAWAEVSYNYFDAPKIQIIMSSSVNPIFLKPNSCNCASHRYSTIQDGAIYIMATVWSLCSQLFPSGNSYNIYKTTQKCVIDTESSVTLLS